MAGCKSESDKLEFSTVITKTQLLQYSLPKKRNNTSFEFQNISANDPVKFWFSKVNGINYRNAKTMLSSVITEGMNEEQKSIAIWKLVAKSGYHYVYDYNHQLKDHFDPVTLVTFPYFLCSEKAGIIVNLANIAGLKSRSVALDGHIVAEIYYSDSWHMFDADEDVIFRNENGVIQSIADLHNKPELLSSKYVEYIDPENFGGFKHYSKYIQNYNQDWIDTSSLISSYTFPSIDILLFPDDKVTFDLKPTAWWDQLIQKKHTLSTKGLLERHLKSKQSNISINNNQVVFTEDFPYFVTELNIVPSEPLKTKVYLSYQNRQTLKTEKLYLGVLQKELNKKFNAPVEPDIYYKYSLTFESLDTKDFDKISILHLFKFNPVSFPLDKAGANIIMPDSAGNKSLAFRILTGD